MPSQKINRSLDVDKLRSSLKLRSFASENKLKQNHPTASQFFDAQHLRPGKIRDHAAKLIASGALAGSLLLGSAPGLPVAAAPTDTKSTLSAPTEAQSDLVKKLRYVLPRQIGPLNGFQEEEISKAVKRAYGVDARAELDGERLNAAYGKMGAEQHLPRYPGDIVANHDTLREKGITPGKGAWGYFANSKKALTPEMIETEKYYVAVQTLYLPDWEKRLPYLREWYKYRRVVVVNPANGKVMICAVADAGPAQWTGKNFGGSPEVMEYLGINYGMQNHPVVLFFLDDKGNKTALGPVEYNSSKNKLIAKK